jgi:hypothetical protein
VEAFGERIDGANTADGKALLRWRGVAVHARWAWWLKDRIDRRFVRTYQRIG